MPIEIINTKGLSQNQLVVEIVNKVQANPNIFKYIARIFSDYNNNNESLMPEISFYIDRTLTSPKLGLDMDAKNRLSSIIRDIYNLSAERFSIARSEILENVTYYLGPVTIGVERGSVYIEPILKDSEVIIGETDIKCDLVFFKDESSPLEYIECKTDIGNVIPKNLPFERAQKPHKNKVTYLDKAYHYLKDNYIRPKIYFACYNLNYKEELINLQKNWDFEHMDFVNAEEIVNGKAL